ncbi:hypothetical protein [Koleobacter methoxysyntrophicus]|uniref:hypothetical protein n=1 Tax=Koleobacter methoxysyntrophicus TaxID=2751313 RepID=UPI0019D56D9F|nr:hypothetical protein [Koleobacter methoxysyntrophicus]
MECNERLPLSDEDRPFFKCTGTKSELLADKVKELGIRGFIRYLTLVCKGSVLDKNRIKKAREKKFMWKLEFVA